MNDAPMRESGAPAIEPQPPKLRTPHFDEISVAIAQPVEPIVRKRDWFAVVAKPRIMIAILMVAALFGTTALALTLQLHRQPHAETAATENPPEEPGSQPEPPLGAIFESTESTQPRIKLRKTRPQVIIVPAKPPVARRVGVITGGSSPP